MVFGQPQRVDLEVEIVTETSVMLQARTSATGAATNYVLFDDRLAS